MAEKCYICGKQAVDRCPVCGKPICEGHKAPFPEKYRDAFGDYACIKCHDELMGLIEKDLARQAKRKKQPSELRTCAICGKEFENVLPKCSVCGKPVCREHRIRYRKKFYFGSPGPERAWYWDRDVRCVEHKRGRLNLKLSGWEIDPEDPPDTPK